MGSFASTLSVDQFIQYKQVGFVSAFVFCTLIQVFSPHHVQIKNDFNNWRVNFPTAILNAVVLFYLVSSVILNLSVWVIENKFGLFQVIENKYIQIFLSVLALDFTAYLWHIANHKNKFLMRFHAVHHSDINFDTSTAIRFHIGEIFISFLVRLLVVVLCGIPLEGLLAFELLYQFFNFFEHGNIKLPLGFERILEKIFITPAYHRKHHSKIPNELNSNYGTIFSFWDRLCKTKTPSHSNEVFALGLPKQNHEWTLKEILFRPFGF